MKKNTREKINALIEGIIKNKLDKYESETEYKPFYEAILEKETILKTSLLHSLYTTFGMSIYEQMALILAKDAGYYAERQFENLGSINNETTILIEDICSKPIGTYSKEYEIAQIRNSIVPGKALQDADKTVDIYLRKDNFEYFIDITTVKPNKKEARVLRRKLLRWAALRFSQKPDLKISTCIGIPYNPYHPEEYSRSFVINNMHRSEILVQNDLWSLFAGYDVFDEIISIFDEIGLYTKKRIAHFVREQSE